MGIPKLYAKNETSFTSRGLGTLKDCIKCNVKEALNGLYELYLEYPIHAIKTPLIAEETIIYASTPTGEQPFRIYNTNKDLGILKVNASHIFYDLLDNLIEDTNVVDKTGVGALSQILAAAQYPHNFTATSDITTVANSRLVRKYISEALIDTGLENSFINRWGGELQRDKFIIKFNQAYGQNRGVKIKYAKNMSGLNVSVDMKSVCTRIMPIGYDGLLLPEKYVDSPKINNYNKPKIRRFEFPDVIAQVEGEVIEGALPLEEAYTLLRNKCNELFTKGKIDTPPTTCEVNMIALQDTEEYKNKAILERVYPFDIVTIQHLDLGINLEVKMNFYEWNSLLERYNKLEFGNVKNNIINTITSIDNIKGEIENIESSVLAKAQGKATELINSGLGGYVIKTREEILIMDTESTSTAQKVWRWNKSGLGYSSTGYNGNFELAMTCDGAIVATFITSGVMNASLIKAGILKSFNNRTWINMETGDFNFADKVKLTGDTFEIDLSDKNLVTQQNVDDTLANFINGTYTDDLTNISTQLDGKIQSYYQETMPYLEYSNIPQNLEYDKNIGDIWYNSNMYVRKSYIYTKFPSGTNFNYTWKEQQVPKEIIDKIDGKKTIYTSKPSSYAANDLWILENDTIHPLGKTGEILTSTTTSSGYVQTHWIKKISYTDDTYSKAVESAIKQRADSIELSVKSVESMVLNDNLVINGDFAVDTSGWTKVGPTMTKRTNTTTTKTWANVYYSTTTLEKYVYTEIDTLVNQKHKFSCKVAQYNATNTFYRIRLQYLDSSSTWITQMEWTGNATETWNAPKIIDYETTTLSTKYRIWVGKLDTEKFDIYVTDFVFQRVADIARKAEITILENQISSKVDAAGAKSVIEQNPSSVKIGFNGISNNFEITAEGVNSKTSTGKKSISLSYGKMMLYDTTTDADVGQVGINTWVGYPSIFGLHIGLKNNSYISLSQYNSTTATYTPYLYANFGSITNKPTGVVQGATLHGAGFKFSNPYLSFPTSSGFLYEYTDGDIGFSGGAANSIYLSSGGSTNLVVSPAETHAYKNMNMHGYSISNGSATLSELSVQDINIVEPTSIFSLTSNISKKVTKNITDNTEWLGSGVIENYQCIIDLPEGIQYSSYSVFLTALGRNIVYLTEKADYYFKVESDNNCTFDFLVKFLYQEPTAYSLLQTGEEVIVEEAKAEPPQLEIPIND